MDLKRGIDRAVEAVVGEYTHEVHGSLTLWDESLSSSMGPRDGGGKKSSGLRLGTSIAAFRFLDLIPQVLLLLC